MGKQEFVIFLGLLIIAAAAAVIYFYVKVIEFFLRAIKLYKRILAQLEIQTQLLHRLAGGTVPQAPSSSEESEEPAAASSMMSRHPGPSGPQAEFSCPQCGEQGPRAADSCWSCGSKFEFAAVCTQCGKTAILEDSEVTDLRFRCPYCQVVNPITRKSLERRIAEHSEDSSDR